jgi:hypothetical protein
MTLFFDLNVAGPVVLALKMLGLTVERHGDHFPPLTYDDVWLEAVGKCGWVVVTHDDLRRNQAAMRALVDHEVGCFLIRGGASKPSWFTVRVLARNWEQMEKIAQTHPRPFLYRLYLYRSAASVQLPAAN